MRNYIFFLLSVLHGALPLFVLAQSPDYNLPKNWMCHPMKSTDASKLSLQLDVILPDLSIDTTIQYAHGSNTGVDMFYVYPTIDNTFSPANVAINNIDTNKAKYVFRMQAGEYAQFGRVFVPYYRQATLGTYVLATKQTQANLFDTAYLDVEAAFMHYLNKYNNGNKIILIGHSQGGGHIGFLLRKLFDNDPVLQSKLIVALLGGMSNYVNKGSVTGGLLQNIPVCPPRDSGYGCGCAIAWRDYKYGTAIPSTYGNTQPLNNPFLTALGLQYTTFDTLTQEVSYYDFGYSTYKELTRAIALNAQDSTTYAGYDSAMYSAQFVKQNASSAGLWIKNIQQPGDQRADPISSAGTDYHIYDMQLVQGDLINILRDMIAYCNPLAVHEITAEKIHIYPSPTNGTLQVSGLSSQLSTLVVYNVLGEKVHEQAVSDRGLANSNSPNGLSLMTIDLSLQPSGIYFIHIRTEGKSFVQKLIIQR